MQLVMIILLLRVLKSLRKSNLGKVIQGKFPTQGQIFLRHHKVAPVNGYFKYIQQQIKYAKHISQISLLLHSNLNILPMYSKIPKERNQNLRKLWFCHSHSRALEERNGRNIWMADGTKLSKTPNSAAADWRKSKFYLYKLLTYDSIQNSCPWQSHN